MAEAILEHSSSHLTNSLVVAKPGKSHPEPTCTIDAQYMHTLL